MSPSDDLLYSQLKQDILDLIDDLPYGKHSKWIVKALTSIVRLSDKEIERLDWKILSASLEDLEKGFELFYPYRHTRKISIFGSARTPEDNLEYQMAVDFARCVSQLGFMVLTGAGGGIMQAANQGAGRENSFGLNIQLPFEQEANPFIEGDAKLINFKYFFTRKLFFLKESDAIALFPGGFGTQDEAFETLTLCQTGKYGPAPLVLIDKPGGDYWHSWNQHICDRLVQQGLVSPEDPSIYTITDNLSVACATIQNFYRIYHSSRYVRDLLILRLNCELSEEAVAILNQEFSDILTKGTIKKSYALPQELGDETFNLPRLVLHFDQKSLGRLYQLIKQINQIDGAIADNKHPEIK